MEILSINCNSKEFPDQLRNLLVKPPIEKLWYRGTWTPKIFARCAAVVGSRRMSRYGRQVVEEVVAQLVGADYTIVSGLMYGVDQLAHRVCLNHGGKAIGVLGYGITNNNEEGATKLIREIESKGGLVLSEYEGDSVSQMWMFPQRNRIVAALSRIVIVVEAGLKSGSLITARLADRLKKEVYAVPGSLFSPTSEGTNWLIETGKARPLTLATLTHLTEGTGRKNGVVHFHGFAKREREIYVCIKSEGPQTANEIARKLSIPAKEIVSQLVQMEMGGIVVEDRGVWMTI